MGKSLEDIAIDIQDETARFKELLLAELKRFKLSGYVERVTLILTDNNWSERENRKKHELISFRPPGRKKGKKETGGVKNLSEEQAAKDLLYIPDNFRRESTFLHPNFDNGQRAIDVSWYGDTEPILSLEGAEHIIAMGIEVAIHEMLERCVIETIGYLSCPCCEFASSGEHEEYAHLNNDRSKKVCESEFESLIECATFHPLFPHEDTTRDAYPITKLKLTFMDEEFSTFTSF